MMGVPPTRFQSPTRLAITRPPTEIRVTFVAELQVDGTGFTGKVEFTDNSAQFDRQCNSISGPRHRSGFLHVHDGLAAGWSELHNCCDLEGRSSLSGQYCNHTSDCE